MVRPSSFGRGSPRSRAALLGATALTALPLCIPLGLPLIADPGSTAVGASAARVIAPLAVAREEDLDFGTIALDLNGSGTVTVMPLGGSVRYGGSAQGICLLACPPPHPARFAVRGEPLRSYRVTVPPSLTITPPGLGSGNAVLIDALTIGTASQRIGDSGELSPDGIDSFEVGGTLHLPAGAAEGRYTAQVPVIVSYM
ncbi:DUF4402 domain-containing protein [Novosphingobium aerophilum]|uniref:DUF4402 domain-containing protein n=1 Tax=Novosphingobium aerophilum TaxID=2839843 RepID=A0A7X1KD66_9SPHN|nr:DUF4402 domain-containing protein [Novosphingobium aerophilum]MBC2652837.1 DUF4402 domain-containing protein [Novosphingobium aerophilum]